MKQYLESIAKVYLYSTGQTMLFGETKEGYLLVVVYDNRPTVIKVHIKTTLDLSIKTIKKKYTVLVQECVSNEWINLILYINPDSKESVFQCISGDNVSIVTETNALNLTNELLRLYNA